MTNDVRTVVVFRGRRPDPSADESIEAVADAHPAWSITVVREGAAAPGPVDDPAGSDRPNVSRLATPDLHGEATLRLVRGLKPWLGIALGAPLLKPALFGIPDRGTVGLRKGLAPSDRGALPGLRELYEGASATVVSARWVVEGLGAGPLIYEAPLAVPPYSTPLGLAVELDLLGARVLLEALRLVDADADAPAGPPADGAGAGQGPARGRPPRGLARKVRRLAWRKRTGPLGPSARLTALAKDAVLLAYLYAYCPMRNALRGARGRCQATVLLYHRVSDAYLDTVTVGVEQFDRHLATLKRHYEVLDLAAFLANRGRPRRRPCVVLTFDDGYEDNLLAALLLRRARLPCTFFLSTRIVGTDRAFPHDLKRLGRRVPALSWEQVRRMASWGFRFGNHTAHHANLGAVPPAEAVEELVTAADDLRRELGEAEGALWLAFPYGQPGDVNDEVRGRLPGLGFVSCLSAHGGVNPPDFDPWNVLRQGVDHKFTPLRLLAAVEGWKFGR